jgi:colanic acid biosynthesis glycosyl transferase WcaI
MGHANVKRLLFILQYYYPDVSGLSQMVGDLTAHLASTKRYECTVLTGSTVRTTQRWNRLPSRLGEVRIQRIRTLKTGKRTILHRLFEYSTFYLGVSVSLFLHHEFDSVVCFTSPPLIGFFAVAGLALSRTPFIYYVEDLYPELLYDMGYIKSPWFIRKLSILNHLILRRADFVVAIGKWMAKKIERNYGLPLSSIRVIENWASGISYSSPPLRERFVVLYTGNLGIAHDFSLLPALLEQLSYIGLKNLEFRFVGAGRQYEKVRRVFYRYRHWPCQFAGYVDRSDLNLLLASGDLFLLAQSERTIGDIVPSKFYGYLAAGRPLLFLGSRKSEIGEFIQKNGIGSVVECEDDVIGAGELIQKYVERGPLFFDACERTALLYRNSLGIDRSVAAFESIVDGVCQQ